MIFKTKQKLNKPLQRKRVFWETRIGDRKMKVKRSRKNLSRSETGPERLFPRLIEKRS